MSITDNPPCFYVKICRRFGLPVPKVSASGCEGFLNYEGRLCESCTKCQFRKDDIMKELKFTDLTDKSIYYFQSGRFTKNYLALFEVDNPHEYYIWDYSELNNDPVLFKVTKEVYDSFEGAKNTVANIEHLMLVMNYNSSSRVIVKGDE